MKLPEDLRGCLLIRPCGCLTSWTEAGEQISVALCAEHQVALAVEGLHVLLLSPLSHTEMLEGIRKVWTRLGKMLGAGRWERM